jgi:hypothetical protein
MDVIFCLGKICHARVLDSSYHELSFRSLFVPNNILLEPRGGIVRLISFLCELFTHRTMIQSRAESTFQTLFGLSISVQAFEAIVCESRMYQSARVVWVFTEWFPS